MYSIVFLPFFEAVPFFFDLLKFNIILNFGLTLFHSSFFTTVTAVC
jgi:hypothetical protein